MPRVFLPASLRALAGGCEVVDVDGGNVDQIIENLDSRFPGMRDRLCHGGSLRAGVSVIVGGSVNPLGLLARTEAHSEIHFLPTIGGG